MKTRYVPPMLYRRVVWAVCVSSLLGACSGKSGSSTPPNDAAQTADSATTNDSGLPDDATVVDASMDAGVDADVDASDADVGTGCVAGPNEDRDHDGFSAAQGDCNDCDPNVNPGAIDVLHTDADGGSSYWGDEDCSGAPSAPASCDQGLVLDDVSPTSGAKALGLCRFTTESDRTWGVISASYVRANGVVFANPGLQVGLMSAFGANVRPQEGQSLLTLSTGSARTASQANACGSETCANNLLGTAPPGFPQDNPSCPPSMDINDDVALEVKLRAPTNATGYSFAFKFNSFEFPYWVCDSYNDQFIALVSPAPSGSINGNIAFDGMHAPVSVNLAGFNVCDPAQSSQFASDCKANGVSSCPMAPVPYCPSGTGELQGTGFDVWGSLYGGAGATSWLRTTAPVTGGSEITIRFAIWDTGDQAFDSTVVLDDFEWITSGSVATETGTLPMPK